MKKTFLMLAAAMMTASVSAQTVTESKTFDNFYIGINAGVATATTGHSSWGKDIQPNASLRIGRWFTPVFGAAVEGTAYGKSFGRNHYFGNGNNTTGTIVNGTNVSLLGTVNLSNWFGGYNGEPRTLEVIPVFGLGWGHTFNNRGLKNVNALTSKLGIDFTFNLGSSKAWQVYIEPSINYALNGKNGYEGVAMNINNSAVQLNLGVNYKFGNSNGTHNFAIAQLGNQTEIDELNARINALRGDVEAKDAQYRGQLADKDRQISDLEKALNETKKALDECNRKPKQAATVTNLQPTVLFRQGQSSVDPAQYAPIELIAQYMKNNPSAKVEIRGYASPEGNPELNQKLSEKRAEAVRDILVKKHKISASRLTTKGMGATSELFEQVEFNRVATFNDNSK